MSKFSFGTDPEFMLKKGVRYVSAIPLVKANHENPIIRGEHRFYWDNVLAECAVKPAYSKEEAVFNIGDCLKHYVEIVKPATIVIQASHTYSKSAMKDKGAKEAGCKPDSCAYTMRLMKDELSPKEQVSNSSFRTCGGHIHLGNEILTNTEGPEPIFLIYLMDLFLGLPSVFMDIDETAPRRRTLYGQAGRFREKPYGMEYRSLSSFWLSSPVLVELIYDISNFVIELLENGQNIVKWDEDLYWDLRNDDLIFGDSFQFVDLDKNILKNCIDESNRKVAKKHLTYIQTKMPSNLFKRIEKEMDNQKPYDLYKEWSL